MIYLIVVLIHTSLITNEVEPCFTYFLTTYLSSFRQYLLKSFNLFALLLSASFLLICMIFKCILHVNPVLCRIYVLSGSFLFLY